MHNIKLKLLTKGYDVTITDSLISIRLNLKMPQKNQKIHY